MAGTIRSWSLTFDDTPGFAYGNGCGSQPLSVTARDAALTGQSVRFDLSNTPQDMAAGAMFTSVDASLPITVSGGNLSMPSLTVPVNSQLVGAMLYVQAAAISPSTNTLGIATSNGFGMTIHPGSGSGNL